jgi:hypothetical protein
MTVDLNRLLKLRLVVGRFGEMDVAQWWNTKGQLGPIGAAALRRGFPRTYRFAQARSVFAVAAQRCTDVFDQPSSATLWRLPVDIEEAFDARWEQWLDHANVWEPVFDSVAGVGGSDLAAALQTLAGVAARDVEAANGFRSTEAGRAVPIPGLFSASDENVSQLALGFVHGSVGALAVPYQHIGTA